MKIKDGRGQHKIKEAEKTAERIKKWVINNPDKTLKECSAKLKIPYSTLLRHWKNIKANQIKLEE